MVGEGKTEGRGRKRRLTFKDLRRFGVGDRLGDGEVGVDLLEGGFASEVGKGRVDDANELERRDEVYGMGGSESMGCRLERATCGMAWSEKGVSTAQVGLEKGRNGRNARRRCCFESV